MYAQVWNSTSICFVLEIIFLSSMASTPFNIGQVKSYRIATFSQLFFSHNSSNNVICLPRKLRPRRSRNLHLPVYRNNYSSPSSSSCQVLVDRNFCYYSRRRHAFDDAKDPEPESKGEADDDDSDDHRALDSLFKFFSAITHRFIPRKFEILAHQWPSVSCCFLSLLHAFQRRKQSWGVFLYLIEVFGNNVEFVFKETLYDGLNIGVQWKFELGKKQVSLGKGFSFSISHSYKGKAMIRNSDTFIKPLLDLLPFRLKIMASLEGLREGINSFLAWESHDKPKKIFTILIALLAITVLIFLLRIPSFKLVFKLSHKS